MLDTIIHGGTSGDRTAVARFMGDVGIGARPTGQVDEEHSATAHREGPLALMARRMCWRCTLFSCLYFGFAPGVVHAQSPSGEDKQSTPVDDRGSASDQADAWGPAANHGSSSYTDEQRDAASRHFGNGVDLFQEGSYRAALVEFQRAYETLPDYRLLFNIAQAQRQVHNYLGAIEGFELYLAEGGAEVPAERRLEVEKALGYLAQRVGRLSITADHDGASVYVDDELIGTTPLPEMVTVNVGRHRVLARAHNGAQKTDIVDVAGGDLIELSLELEKLAIEEKVTEQTWSRRKRAAFAGFILTGALAGTAVYTGVLTIRRDQSLDDSLQQYPANASQVHDDTQSVQRLSRTTDITAGLAAAALGASLWLWIGDSKPEHDSKGVASRPTTKKRGLRLRAGSTGSSLVLRGVF